MTVVGEIVLFLYNRGELRDKMSKYQELCNLVGNRGGALS